MYFFHYRNVADKNSKFNFYKTYISKKVLKNFVLQSLKKKFIMALEEVKSMLRAVLMSCKEGVPAYVLQSKYTWLVLLKVF